MAELEQIAAARDEWLDVLARGDDVRADAEARLSACREALDLLGERLQGLGYPVHPIVRPIARAQLDDVERRLDAAELAPPPLLWALWEVVGAVSVLDLARYRHVAFWTRRLGPTDRCTDGLHIDAPGDLGQDHLVYVDHLVDERESWLDSGLAAEGEPFEWPIAPDDLHKDDISGGEPYGLVLGSGRWDHRVVHMSWRGDPVTAPDGAPDLLSYVRTAVLECGGFPGLLGVPAFEPDRLHLTADLPIF